MDPLDDVFAAMRLKSALYSRLLPHAPWGISFVRSASIRFGFMVSGHGMLIVEGVENSIELQQGDGFLVKPETLFSLVDKEGANKQVISSQADSLIKISRIWADFFPANTSNQPI
ncbi:cupin domain-containing protein, partial [Klebsiella pneumoniae]|uniref:cupin domain-containing protein n=1 Tax=Klebsiella pneumoniae TaxID=573 RepID=UPI003A4DB7FB